MLRWFLASALLTCSCDAFQRDNPAYCDGPGRCELTPGMICDTVHHHCISDTAPRVTGITPWSVTRMGGTSVTLTGQNFKDGLTVQIDGRSIKPTVISPTELQFESPMLTRCGAAPVTVLDGQQAVAGQVELRYRLNTLGLAIAGTIPIVNNTTSAIIAADFDQDGKTDIALSSGANPGLLIGLGGGDFTFLRTIASGINASYAFLRGATINGAAGQDLLAVNSGQVAYYPGPAFSPTPAMTMDSANLGDFAVGDIDNDGHSDVVILPRTKDSVSAFTYNPATDQFAGTLPSIFALPDQGTRVTVDDFNNDGFGDIAIGTQPDAQLSLCLGQSKTPSFGCTSSRISTASGAPTRLGSAVVAADGKRLLMMATAPLPKSELIAVSVGPGGALTSTLYTTFADIPRVVLLDDINCDGLRDLVVYGNRDNVLRVFSNLGNGSFSMIPEMLNLNLVLGGGMMDDVFAVAIGDFNGDGLPDVATVNSIKSVPTVNGTVFRNTGS